MSHEFPSLNPGDYIPKQGNVRRRVINHLMLAQCDKYNADSGYAVMGDLTMFDTREEYIIWKSGIRTRQMTITFTCSYCVHNHAYGVCVEYWYNGIAVATGIAFNDATLETICSEGAVVALQRISHDKETRLSGVD